MNTRADPASVLIVEDHEFLREAVTRFLSTAEGVVLADAVATAEEALARLERGIIDLVLVDLMLPGMDGLPFVREVRKRWPGLPCLVTSGYGSSRQLEDALAAGASGFLVKGDAHEMLDAIRCTLRGETYISKALRGDGGDPAS